MEAVICICKCNLQECSMLIPKQKLFRSWFQLQTPPNEREKERNNYVRRKHCNRHISKMFSWYFYQSSRSRPISISFAPVNWLPCFFNINHAAHICKVFLVSVFVSVKVNDWFFELSFKSWCSVIHFLGAQRPRYFP